MFSSMLSINVLPAASDDFGRFILSLQAHDRSQDLLSWLATNIGVFAVTVLLGFVASSLGKRFLQNRTGELQKLLRTLASPLAISVLVAATIAVMHRFGMEVTLLVVLLDLLFAYLVTRLFIHCLATVISSLPIRTFFTYFAASIIWGLTFVHLFGVEKETFDALDSIYFGKKTITLSVVIDACSVGFLAVLSALFLWKMIEKRLDRIQGLDPNVLLAINRIGKLSFVTLFLMVSLSYAGLDLTNVTVFFGAFAVGLGLGFQKIVSSYVSGLILLFERSVRLGDYVTINEFSGTVETMTGRFTVIRASDGNAIMIPNEIVVSATVVNSSQKWDNVEFIRKTVKITVPHCLNIHHMIEKLAVIPLQNAGVTAKVPPAVSISGLTNLGVVLDISFSVINPAASGGGAITNNLYKAIFDELKRSGAMASFQAQSSHDVFHE